MKSKQQNEMKIETRVFFKKKKKEKKEKMINDDFTSPSHILTFNISHDPSLTTSLLTSLT